VVTFQSQEGLLAGLKKISRFPPPFLGPDWSEVSLLCAQTPKTLFSRRGGKKLRGAGSASFLCSPSLRCRHDAWLVFFRWYFFQGTERLGSLLFLGLTIRFPSVKVLSPDVYQTVLPRPFSSFPRRQFLCRRMFLEKPFPPLFSGSGR